MSDFFYSRQNRIYRVFLTVFLVFVIAFIGHHLWTYLHKPYETETVAKTTLVDEITLDGFFVRDELVVPGGDSGVLKCNYEDGQRVRAGSDLASVYLSQQDQINLQLIEEYTKEYEQLKTLSAEGAVAGSRIDIIVKQIEQLQAEYVGQIQSGNYTKAKEIKDSLTYQLNKLQLCKGDATDYSAAMQQLQTKIGLLSADSKSLYSIAAPANGYFSAKTDGMEAVINLDAADAMTVSDAVGLLDKKKASSSGLGKIVTSNYWYYCAIAKTNELTEQLHEGQKVNVHFSSLGSGSYTLELIRAEKDENGNTLFVFKSSIMNKNFINARYEKASITVASYEGIGISKQALRFKDGVKGVYIVRGKNLLFRRVDPVYEDEDIVISRYSTDASYISLYDNVVIGGELISGGT